MDSGVEKVPKEDFELSSDDELDLGIYLLIKAAGQKKKKKNRLRSSNCVAFSFSVSVRCGGGQQPSSDLCGPISLTDICHSVASRTP